MTVATPVDGVPWTGPGEDDMTEEIAARNAAAEAAADLGPEVTAIAGRVDDLEGWEHWTPHAIGQWYKNPLASNGTRTLVPTTNELGLYPMFSGPDGCTISDLDITTTIVGSATAVVRAGIWVVRNQARPFKWDTSTVWADLLLDAGTKDTAVGTGQKTWAAINQAIPANTWFAIGGVHQVATAATTTVEGVSGATYWSPFGSTTAVGVAGAPIMALYDAGVTGAFAATFTPDGGIGTGRGIGLKRSA